MTSAANIVDPILIGITLLIYGAYHIYFWYMVYHFPLKTASGQIWRSRQRWCSLIMENGMIIEGVQTIRNSIMSTSVLASTSLALGSIVIAFLATFGDISQNQASLLKSKEISDGWRFFTIIVFFSCAFFSYMQSIRSGNHGSFLIAIPIHDEPVLDDNNNDTKPYSVTPAYVAKVLNRGAMFFTIGTRFFYLAFLGVMWLFGPIPPLVACIILVIVLFSIDRYPDPHYHHRKHYERVDITES